MRRIQVADDDLHVGGPFASGLSIMARRSPPAISPLPTTVRRADSRTRASRPDDAMAMIAVDTHGYGEVAQHPESIFSVVDIAVPTW